jgi:hypothetical protein
MVNNLGILYSDQGRHKDYVQACTGYFVALTFAAPLFNPIDSNELSQWLDKCDELTV